MVKVLFTVCSVYIVHILLLLSCDWPVVTHWLLSRCWQKPVSSVHMVLCMQCTQFYCWYMVVVVVQTLSADKNSSTAHLSVLYAVFVQFYCWYLVVIVVLVLTEVPVLTSCQAGQCTVHSVLCVLSAYYWHGIDQQCLCCCPGADRSGGPSLYCLLQSSRSVYTPSMKLCSIVIHINFTHVNKAKQFELCYLHSVHNFISCHKHEGRVKNHFKKNQQNERNWRY